jgi:hypothetical protein
MARTGDDGGAAGGSERGGGRPDPRPAASGYQVVRSRAEVRFALRGDGRSQLSVEHSRLADAGEVAAMKDYWSEALERLDAVLAGRPVSPPL